MKKLTKGQEVWVIGLFRRNSHEELKKSVIEKVGNKYFTIAGYTNLRFNIETLYHSDTIYSPSYKVYLSKQSYQDEKEAVTLNQKFHNIFRSYNTSALSLGQLREIDKIVTGTPPGI